VILDLRGVSPITNYFVICTGTSSPQMRAVADKVCDYGESVGQKVWRTAGLEGGQWVVLDFVDVMVHVFGPAHRRYYDLELMWGAAPKVRWKRPVKAKPKPTPVGGPPPKGAAKPRASKAGASKAGALDQDQTTIDSSPREEDEPSENA
jgi:ribosome-associated protein